MYIFSNMKKRFSLCLCGEKTSVFSVTLWQSFVVYPLDVLKTQLSNIVPGQYFASWFQCSVLFLDKCRVINSKASVRLAVALSDIGRPNPKS